jgi:hypothetical protein
MIGYAAPPKPSGGGLTSLLAGVLALVTAGLAVGGSFAPITSLRNSFESDGDPFVDASKSTWWGTSYDGSSDPFDDQTTLIGLTLVLVAALLVLGAVFAFVASRTRTSGPTSGGRSLISAGVGVLAGVMLLQVLDVVEQVSRFNDRDLQPGESLDYKPGLGLILPLCGLGLGLVAVVLAHVGQRPRAARVEPNTPRMGFQAPYGYKPGMPVPPQAPASERPTDVDTSSPAPEDEFDDAADTQVVSNATATGAEPPVPPTASEQATPATGSEPEAPKAVSEPAASSEPAAGAEPEPPAAATPEPPAAVAPPAPVTPPAPASSVAASAPEADAIPTGDTAPAASGSNPEPPATTPAPSPEAPIATPASGNAAPAAAAPTTASTEGASAAPSQGPTPLTDLPAAPPAPELVDEKKDGK